MKAKCPPSVQKEIRKAIDLIHRQDDYEGGMELLCKLAGVPVKKVSVTSLALHECQHCHDTLR